MNEDAKELQQLLYCLFKTIGSDKEVDRIWEESTKDFEKFMNGSPEEVKKSITSMMDEFFNRYNIADRLVDFFPGYMKPLMKQTMKSDSHYGIDIIANCVKIYGRGKSFEEMLKYVAIDLAKHMIVGDIKNKILKPLYG